MPVSIDRGCFDSSVLTGSRWHTHHRRRYPQYNAVRFTFTVLFGLLLSTTFWRVGMHRWEQLSHTVVLRSLWHFAQVAW